MRTSGYGWFNLRFSPTVGSKEDASDGNAERTAGNSGHTPTTARTVPMTISPLVFKSNLVTPLHNHKRLDRTIGWDRHSEYAPLMNRSSELAQHSKVRILTSRFLEAGMSVASPFAISSME